MNHNKIKKITMKEMSKEIQPREKILKYGAETLSDSELIALILRTGNKNETVVEMANRLLLELSLKDRQSSGLNVLRHASFDDFVSIDGIGETKASQMLAIMEIAKRINSNRVIDIDQITSPSKAAEIFMNEFRHQTIEEFCVVGLDTKKRIKFVEKISKGTIDSTLVHPREVFFSAIGKRVHSIMLIHNHPTGVVTPSNEDIKLTKRLEEVGKLLGIPVIDHIILGDGIYFSFLEENLL